MKVYVREWKDGRIIIDSVEYGVSQEEIKERNTYSEEGGVGNGTAIWPTPDQRPFKEKK